MSSAVGASSWTRLFAAATRARKKAYAPYSRFLVGAALLLEGGAVVAGCNVENASYPVSLCAERNAIGAAVARGLRRILAVAIVTDSAQPCPPCGMCRQMIAELAGPETPVRSRTVAGAELRSTVAQLLPHAFDKSFL